MRIKFKQAIELKDAAGKRPKKFPVGVHEVEHHHLTTKWFNRCLKAGFVEDAPEAEIEKPVSLIDRQKALAEKLAKLPAPKLGSAPQAVTAPASNTPPVNPIDDSTDAEDESEEGNDSTDADDADEVEQELEEDAEDEAEETEEGSDAESESDSSKSSKKRKKKRNR